MNVIVDTSVWSLALRHDKQEFSSPLKKLHHMIHDHRVQMIGPIRQEILSGICNGYGNVVSAMPKILQAAFIGCPLRTGV